MSRKAYGIILMFLFLGQPLCWAKDSGNLPGSLLSGTPVLDGKPDDAFWNQAEAVSGFVTIENKPADPDTTVKIAYTQKGIYILFLCDLIKSQTLKCKETIHDDLHGDDWVEVFLDPGGTKKNYYHFIANPSGIKREEYRGDVAWTCDWTVAAGKVPGKWLVEMFIPFSALGINSNTKPVWGINFARRTHNPNSGSPWTQWHHTGGSFHRPDLFATYGPLKIDLKQYACTANINLPAVCWPGKNSAQVNVKDQSGASRKVILGLNVYNPTRKLLSTTTADVTATGNAEAATEMSFTLPEVGRYYLETTVTDAATKDILRRTPFQTVQAINQPVMFMDQPESGVVFAPDRNKPLKLRVLIPPSVLEGKNGEGKIELQAIQPNDRIWASLPDQPMKQNEIKVDWPIQKWPAGRYRIQAVVQAGQWQKAVSREVYLVPKSVENYVRIDEFGRIIVKQPGKEERPFFPIGFFSGRTDDPKIMKILADAGINALQDYGFIYPRGDALKRNEKCRQFMDLALEYGCMVLPSVKDLPDPYNPQTPPDPLNLPDSAIEKVTETILDYRHHPALLSWYIADEPECRISCKPEKLAKYHRLVRSLDPLHPTSAAFCHSYAVSLFYDGYDVAMPDRYPYPISVTDSYAIMNSYFGDVHKRLAGRKPFWATLQAYDRKMDTSYLSDSTRTYPLYKEIRLMTFQSLTWGTRGVWYFAWSWLNRNPPKYEQMKQDLFRVTREISALSPVLLSAKQELAEIPDASQVRGIWLEHDKAWYLLLANGYLSGREVTVALPKTLTGKAGNSVVQVIEGKEERPCPNVKPDNGKLIVKLADMEALVVKIQTVP